MRVLFIFLLSVWTGITYAQKLNIHVHLDTSIKKSLSGRLYIFTQPDTSKGVRDPDPFNPSPTFIKDVQNWNFSKEQVFNESDRGFPVTIASLKPGWYKFAAIMDVNTEERNNTSVPGNCFSRQDVLAEVRQDSNTDIHILINSVFREKLFKENESTKEVTFKSKTLSTFHKKDIFMKAAVILPNSYQKDSLKKYPVVFIIPGWGGTHFDVFQKFAADRYGIGMGKEKIYVYLNPETQTPFGLHEFVDSKVNGPWGNALVHELKPWLIKNYRIDPDPSQHFLAGQSSGGYGVLWLQLNYPDHFGLCWSASPDPVDFSNFTGINLYEKGANLYYDNEGKERPFFIWNGKPVSTMKKMLEFERFMGDGGQQQSFEATYGIPGNGGRPIELYDQKSGEIIPSVIFQWKKYDLGLFVQQHWKNLSKKLDGKVFVFAGAEDNFFLQHSVEAFRIKAQKVNAGLVAELIPKANHWTIWNKEFVTRMHAEMDKRIRNDL